MLKAKITICAILSLVLIGLSAAAHHILVKERSPYTMRPPIPEGSYRIYNDYDSNQQGTMYSPYLPREYVRIVKRAPSQ